MNDASLKPLNLWLAGRSYRILVKEEEVEYMQKSVKLVDQKIAELKLQYAGKDDQDFLAMCLLMYAAESKGQDSFHINDIIKKLHQALDSALESSS